MKQLGRYESLLYKKLSKTIDYDSIGDVLNNLDVLSHYFQNYDIGYLSNCVSSKAISLLSSHSNIDSLQTKAEEPFEQYGLFSEFLHPIFSTVGSRRFTFIDLFAGIGGFRLACQMSGGKCVFSSDEYSLRPVPQTPMRRYIGIRATS